MIHRNTLMPYYSRWCVELVGMNFVGERKEGVKIMNGNYIVNSLLFFI
jgi:hypothetical protein